MSDAVGMPGLVGIKKNLLMFICFVVKNYVYAPMQNFIVEVEGGTLIYGGTDSWEPTY